MAHWATNTRRVVRKALVKAAGCGASPEMVKGVLITASTVRARIPRSYRALAKSLRANPYAAVRLYGYKEWGRALTEEEIRAEYQSMLSSMFLDRGL